MNVLPAIVSVADLAVVTVLAATVKVADPFPLPLSLVNVIQLTGVDALHVQPAAAVTALEPDPPAPPTDKLAGEMLKVQAVPVCVTVNVVPAMVSVPVRVDVPFFAATE